MNPRIRSGLMFTALLIILVASVTYIGITLTPSVVQEMVKVELIKNVLPAALLGAIIILLLCIASYSDENFSEDLNKIKTARENLEKKIEANSNKNVFYTIQLSLNQVDQYYILNRAQARNSFFSSITFAIIGFITIIVGIWFFYFNENPNITLTAISGIAGLLTEFVGAANFHMYKTTQQQLNRFFDKLERAQYIALCVELCEGLADKEKNEMKCKLINSLISSNTSLNNSDTSV